MPPPPTARPPCRAVWLTALGAAWFLAGCARGPSGTGPSPRASDAEWRALATPRPPALPGAARLSLADVELLGDPGWPEDGAVSARLGVTELVAAGLLRRADVAFVERRRFAAAVAAERSGASRPVGAPRAGVSPGAELTAVVTWVAVSTGGASLEVRLSESATGRVAQTRRALLRPGADPVGLARAAVATILGALDDMGRLPAWDDPVPPTAADPHGPSGVSSAALADFLAGLAAEEQWRWEASRVAYSAAARAAGFVEADAALARAARLRLGGTLGES